MLKQIFHYGMKKIFLFFAVYFMICTCPMQAQPCTAGLSGTYTIGPGGNFTSITAAIASLQTNGLAGNVSLELQTGYTASGETYPLTFPAIPCQDLYAITLQPAAGTAGFTLTTSSSTAVLLNGIHNLIIDGRAGGTGTAKALTIESTALNGNAITLQNDASGNVLQYLAVKSVATTATNGIILIGTTTGTTGNDSNRISYCDIGHPTSFSSNLLFANGTAGKVNNGNEISNNNLFNFFSSTINSAGVYVSEANSAYRIIGNSFYQKNSIGFGGTPRTCNGVRILTTSGTGFVVEDNFIGGTTPLCGGTKMICTGNGSFGGIYISAGNSGESNVNNNTISNLSFTMSGQASHTGIFIVHGKIKCGSVSGNTIGSATALNSIVVLSSVSFDPWPVFSAIYSGASDSVTIANNIIGGIAGDGIGKLEINGIMLTAAFGRYHVANNVIGSPDAATVFSNRTLSYALLVGIRSTASSSSKVHLITGNQISNLGNTSTGLNSQVLGIYTSAGQHQITSNSIHHLSSAASSSASIIGIVGSGGSGSQSIGENRIYGLKSTSSSGTPAILGIAACNGSSSTTMPINNNFVHSLTANSPGAVVTGIKADCSSTSLFNNMIRLGIDVNGNSDGGNYEIHGIYQGTLSGSHKVSHNSVYIGGATTGNQNTYAFYCFDSLTLKIVSNNIFSNARSNNGTGKNYGASLRGIKKKQPGLTMVANLYFTQGVNGFTGYFNGNNFSGLPEWRDATGADSLSGTGDPSFLSPASDSATVNMHLGSTSPAEGAGIPDNSIILDFDNSTRSALSPVDIGADAGDFIAIDNFPPDIYYTPLNSTSSFGNRVIAVNITDVGTGIASGLLQPRLWVRRSAPVATSWQSFSGSLISGNMNNGVWNFTIDYAAIGITPMAQDFYEYYIIAQDVSSNISFVPARNAIHTDVNTQVTAPENAHKYRLLATVPATVNVGVGEQFTSLTGANGLFRYLNENVLNTDVTANVTSDLLEDGTYALGADSTNGMRITIRPADASMKNIYNSTGLARSMLRFYNMSNVVLDGSYAGSGKFLRIINTRVPADSCYSAVLIDSSSTYIVIQNCLIEGNASYFATGHDYANITIGFAGVNKEIEIRENKISGAAGSPGVPGLAVRCIDIEKNKNKKITIVGNEIFNFSLEGIFSYEMTDSCRIDSNHFYFNSSLVPVPITMPTSLYLGGGTAHQINDNYIGGSGPFCSGLPWTISWNSPAPFQGIYILQPGHLSKYYVRRNKVQNINIQSASSSFSGIYCDGNLVLEQNLVGHPTNANSIVSAGTGMSGMVLSSRDSSLADANLVANMSANTTTIGNGSISGINIISYGRDVIKNNIVHSLSSNGSRPYYRAIIVSGININDGSVPKGIEAENNTVYNLLSSHPGAGNSIRGILVSSGSLGSPTRDFVRRNRVYDLRNHSDSGLIYGLELGFSDLIVENNQVSITNGTNTNKTFIYGISGGSSSDSNYYYYNSIYIGGTSSGTAKSFGFKVNDGRVMKFQNNIIHNERTGGTGNYALGVWVNPSTPPKWSASTSAYNFYVVPDSLRVATWGFGDTAKSMIAWRSVTGGDQTSFGALSANAPANSFFTDIASGNLNINNLDAKCWYVNGKGLPVSTISGDFDSISNIRSTSAVTGPTDIGSDEFNTTTTPGPLEILGRHLPGMTDSLMLNGRVLATITWGNTGTLPTIGNARFYSGEWPNDLTNAGTVVNARTLNGWLQIPVTGGAGYTYSITYYYDSSMLGRVQDLSKLTLHKRNIGETGSWQMLSPTTVNISAKTATAVGLTSFSEFSGAESNAPLALPGDNACPGGTVRFTNSITGAGYTYQWQADDGNGFVNVINNSIYSGVNSTTLVITGAPSAYNRYKYRCVVNTGSGTANSDEFLLKITSSWKGTVDSDWNNPLNWSCEQVPDANTDVLIGTGLVNYPVINTNVICRSIIASSGSLIQVNSGAAIELTGK